MSIGKQQELNKSFRGDKLHHVSDDLSLERATSHAILPIRVLAFLESRTIAGAVKPVLEFVAEATESKAAGIEVTLVCYLRREQENELTRTIRSRGIQLQLVDERHPFDLKIVKQLQAMVRKLQPDIIWTNNSKSHFLVHVSGVDRSAEWIAFHHGYTRESLRSRVYNQLDRWSLRHASRVVTVCQKFAQDLQHMGVSAARVSVGPNPIRPLAEETAAQTKQEARAVLEIDASSTVLLSVGRLSAEKGHLDLLHAVSSLKATRSSAGPLKLFVVGNGPLGEKLEKVSKDFGLEDVVTFTGYRSDVQSYYRAADVFVLPSLSEGCPNVLLEAMCAGLPVVATDAGGVPEIAINGRNALVVPKHNPSQLAAALQTILSNVDLRKRFADASQEVVQQHTPSAYFQEISTIFQDVLRDSRCAAGSNGLHN